MIDFNYEYNNTGSKITILFLHGWGLSGNSFDKIISNLNSVSYIKLDLCGFGNSDMPKDYFDVYEYAYQIFLLLKKIRVKSVMIVGHSFGGRLAIILSSVFKINIKNLVLTSSAGLIKFDLNKYMKIMVFKLVKILVDFKILPVKILNHFGSRDYKNARGVMQKIFTRTVNQDLSFLLHKINVSTYLVWDKKDKDTPYWICRKLHKCINNSNLIFYNNGGHFVAFCNISKFSNLLINICN